MSKTRNLKVNSQAKDGRPAREGGQKFRPRTKNAAPRGMLPNGWAALGLGLVAGVAVLLAGFWVFSEATRAAPEYGARYVPDQGRDHITPGTSHPPYNSIPATSGWHYDTPAPWRVYDQPVAEETLIHNLEHGGIVIQYWCPDGCAADVQNLKALVGRYPSKVLLAPYARPLPNRFALTAWTWIDTFDQLDERRIEDFIRQHKDQGPEKVMD